MKKAQGEETSLKDVIAHVLSDEQGILLFRFLMQQCGYQSSSVDINQSTGDLNVHQMIKREALRTLYLQLRQFITPAKLNQIEIVESKIQVKQGETVQRRKNSWAKVKQMRQEMEAKVIAMQEMQEKAKLPPPKWE